MSGWISLSFLNDPYIALQHFKILRRMKGYPISLARGAYWIGKTYEKIGNEKLATKFYEEGSKFLTTYYGQLSFSKIKPFEDFELVDDSKYSKEFEKEFNDNPLTKHVIFLYELNKPNTVKAYLKHLAELNIEKGSEVLAAKLATNVGRYDYSIQVSKKSII